MGLDLTFWKRLEGELAAGHRVFLALVAGNTRHSPGTAGARMLVSESGARVGTIGGGVMEYKLLDLAAQVLRRGDLAPEIRTLHHRWATAGERSGMICAGSQTNLYLLCRPDVELVQVRRLITVLTTGGSGTLSIAPEGMTVVEEPPDLSVPQRWLEPGGPAWRYCEQLLNRKRLAIFGGGHCALALTRTMVGLGYDVFVFETRRNVFEDELEQVVRSVTIVDDFSQAGARVNYPELTLAVIMTTDMANDVRALAGVIPRPFPFIGLMGAPAKLAEISKRLLAEGFSATDLERVHAPVGLAIASHTPQEIAISVAAQILQLRGENGDFLGTAAGLASGAASADTVVPDAVSLAAASAETGSGSGKI